MSEPRPVVFVGVGPGDPGLLTLRGERCLSEAQVVVVDAGVSPTVLDAVADSAERVHVGEEAGGVARAEVLSLLAARAAAGLRVVRLLAGDAADYAAEATALAAAGLRFEVVPGVSGVVAAVLYAGIALAPGRPVVVVDAADAGGIDWARLGQVGGTLLARVTGSSLDGVVSALARGGRPPETPVALIAEATSLRQRTVTGRLGGLASAAARIGLSSPALLVVGEAAGPESRLAWLERRPLYGRRVLVTRPRAQAGRLSALLEANGAEVVALPAIRLEPPDDWRPLDDAIGCLAAFRWVVFTSANGVAAFRERLAVAGRDARALSGARLAAIGSETAEALRQGGLEADLVPSEYRAEGLVEALRPHVEPGTQVLLVRAAEARELLPRELERLGARVTVVPAYRTVLAKEGADRVVGLLERREIDVVTFTSSSTVRGFMALLAPDEVRRLLAGVALAAIGPITAATIAEYGLEALIMPREFTAAALATAIAAHFARHG